mgnify:CR=1 FL=1
MLAKLEPRPRSEKCRRDDDSNDRSPLPDAGAPGEQERRRRCHRADHQRHDRRGRQRQQDDGAEAAEARADRGPRRTAGRSPTRKCVNTIVMQSPAKKNGAARTRYARLERHGAGENVGSCTTWMRRNSVIAERSPEPEATEGRRQLRIDRGGSGSVRAAGTRRVRRARGRTSRARWRRTRSGSGARRTAYERTTARARAGPCSHRRERRSACVRVAWLAIGVRRSSTSVAAACSPRAPRARAASGRDRGGRARRCRGPNTMDAARPGAPLLDVGPSGVCQSAELEDRAGELVPGACPAGGDVIKPRRSLEGQDADLRGQIAGERRREHSSSRRAPRASRRRRGTSCR